MKPLSADTEPWAEEMQVKLLREAGPARRLQLAFQLSAFGWTSARMAFDQLFPEESADQRDLRFLTQVYGAELAQDFIAYRGRIRARQTETISP